MRRIVLIAHNLRSCHNVGSLLRTADGLGIQCVCLTGYSPYPSYPGDKRLPHLARKLDKQIHKTALGAEKSQAWLHIENPGWLLLALKLLGYEIAALEQSNQSINLVDYHAPDKTALIVGREVEGLENDIMELVDVTTQIPMLGEKESFNVVQAAAMALFYLRFL